MKLHTLTSVLIALNTIQGAHAIPTSRLPKEVTDSTDASLATALSPTGTTFTCVSSSTTWAAPSTTATISIAAAGGNGGTTQAVSISTIWGSGALVQGYFLSQDGDILVISVGCPGGDSHNNDNDDATGGWGGQGRNGGNGDGASHDAWFRSSGAGGGATTVELVRDGVTSTLVIAGGGGGSGGPSFILNGEGSGGDADSWQGSPGGHAFGVGGSGGGAGVEISGAGQPGSSTGGSGLDGLGGGGGGGYYGGATGHGNTGAEPGGGGGSGSSCVADSANPCADTTSDLFINATIQAGDPSSGPQQIVSQVVLTILDQS